LLTNFYWTVLAQVKREWFLLFSVWTTCKTKEINLSRIGSPVLFFASVLIPFYDLFLISISEQNEMNSYSKAIKQYILVVFYKINTNIKQRLWGTDLNKVSSSHSANFGCVVCFCEMIAIKCWPFFNHHAIKPTRTQSNQIEPNETFSCVWLL